MHSQCRRKLGYCAREWYGVYFPPVLSFSTLCLPFIIVMEGGTAHGLEPVWVGETAPSGSSFRGSWTKDTVPCRHTLVPLYFCFFPDRPEGLSEHKSQYQDNLTSPAKIQLLKTNVGFHYMHPPAPWIAVGIVCFGDHITL